MIAMVPLFLAAVASSPCAGATETVSSVSAADTEVRGTETRRIHAAYKSALRSLARALVAQSRVRHELARAGAQCETAWSETSIAGLDDHDALERERLMAESSLVAETWDLATGTELLAGELATAVGMRPLSGAGSRGEAPAASSSRQDLVRSAEAGAFAARQAAQLAEVAADRASLLTTKTGPRTP